MQTLTANEETYTAISNLEANNDEVITYTSKDELFNDLDIEPVYPNDPDYKLIQDVKNEDTISLDEFMKLGI